MADLNEGMWNVFLQPQQTYLHYDNAYGHETCQRGDLPWEIPTHKIMTLWSSGLARSRDKLNPL